MLKRRRHFAFVFSCAVAQQHSLLAWRFCLTTTSISTHSWRLRSNSRTTVTQNRAISYTIVNSWAIAWHSRRWAMKKWTSPTHSWGFRRHRREVRWHWSWRLCSLWPPPCCLWQQLAWNLEVGQVWRELLLRSGGGCRQKCRRRVRHVKMLSAPPWSITWLWLSHPDPRRWRRQCPNGTRHANLPPRLGR